MMKLLATLILLCCLACSLAQDKVWKTRYAGNMRRASGNMYYQVARIFGQNQNVIFSPLSIYQTLGMVLAGARGETHDEIRRAMRLSDKQNFTNERIHNLNRKMYQNTVQRPTGQILHLSNAIFLQQGYELKSDFVTILMQKYRALVENMDFSMAAVTAKRINEWVEQKTENKIQNLVDPNTLDALTRMVIVNAVYFKAKWKQEFTEMNESLEFHLSNGTPVDVDGMKMDGFIRTPIPPMKGFDTYAIPYHTTTDYTSYFVIIIPYEEKTNLDVLSPKVGTVLEGIQNITGTWRREKRKLKMPTFTVTQDIDAKALMTAMGVTRLFDPRLSDLSGIAEGEELSVSDFVHKAYISVNKEGTEAAAASSLNIIGRSVGEAATILINRPFLYGIYNEHAGIFSFLGKIEDPRQ